MVLIEEVLSEILHPPNPIPHIAFEHLSQYTKNHLSQSVAVYGKVDHGRPRQSQVQPGTSCAIFSKSRRFKDIKYDTDR